MTEFITVDRSGRTVIVRTLIDGRLVFISQDGWKETREIVTVLPGVK